MAQQTNLSPFVQPQTVQRGQPPLSSQRKQEPEGSVRHVSGHREQEPSKRAALDVAKEEESMVSPEGKSVEIVSSVPEVSVEKSVEAVVEKSSDKENPEISEELKQAGITRSGPGIPIDTVVVEENQFSVNTMPMTYQEAVSIDKTTKLTDSKHWLAELVMYVWKKLDPMIDQKTKKEKK